MIFLKRDFKKKKNNEEKNEKIAFDPVNLSSNVSKNEKNEKIEYFNSLMHSTPLLFNDPVLCRNLNMESMTDPPPFFNRILKYGIPLKWRSKLIINIKKGFFFFSNRYFSNLNNLKKKIY